MANFSTANEIRQAFFDFFESKGHKIVSSAPIVLKDDPTLMFTNAGMNQFKDLFLGFKKPEVRRIANSQKCLRVSGKHNDLEEVGRDSYHHTMFEMLGNWSIGDYFKEEAIAWAWELLTKVYGLNPSKIYASVFSGDEAEGLSRDDEAANIWKKYLPEDRILYFNKKDNFWEMGDTGPCGPCSELHYDMRTDEAIQSIPGRDLVNMGDPFLVEIWNLVFIQYNRKADGSLDSLPEKHVDTGMGFERLCRALSMQASNYDTDVFASFVKWLENETEIKYTGKYDDSSMSDVAMRVICDHLRAVSFAIADGELPGNNGAAYVIRRILRRAIRYYFTYLNRKSPLIHNMVDALATKFKDVFPELFAQRSFVEKVIFEEEKSFLRTLEAGLKRIDNLQVNDRLIDGKVAFELYDTYGFPIDLTRLIANEKGWTIDELGFESALSEQKNRSKSDAKKETGDWTIFDEKEVEFVGYDHLEIENARITKYRIVKQKEETYYQVVLDKTPFYAEGGGQVGDTGYIKVGDDIYKVTNTKKENDLPILYLDRIPEHPENPVIAVVDSARRRDIERNHSVTHLMHAALRQTLGTHVQQKGSLVKNDSMRFDFSHFSKMTEEEILAVESIVNQKIRENIALQEDRKIAIAKAKELGAMMLFGEKYGDNVRMITFDPTFSRELCGGCHVKNTGQIGYFKIISEAAIAAGVRRVEVVTGSAAEQYINNQIDELSKIKSFFKSPINTISQVQALQDEVKSLRKEIEELKSDAIMGQQNNLLKQIKKSPKGIQYLSAELNNVDSKNAKTLAYNILNQAGDAIILFGLKEEERATVMVAISETLIKAHNLHAGNMVKSVSAMIDGGGGGQAFFATAGGKKVEGINLALSTLVDQL